MQIRPVHCGDWRISMSHAAECCFLSTAYYVVKAREDIMQARHSIDAKLTRRRLVASGVAGAIALASDPVAAQRSPATPPARVKGAPVWLDLDQQELDNAYDQNVYAFNFRNIAERRAANNETALAVIGKPERVAYGPTDIEKVDLYRTRRPSPPIMVCIHGGGWRNGRSAAFALFAEGVVKMRA